MNQGRLSKRQKKRVERETKQAPALNLNTITPLTVNQTKTFKSFTNPNNHLFLHGAAGTGKTFVSVYLALNDVLKERSEQEKVVIVRSVVPSRDMGFLPGSAKDKSREYEAPYIDICKDLFGRSDAYSLLKQRGLVEFITTSFVRGCTFNNTYLIVDEVQNLSWDELSTIVTRVGEGTRIIFCGDMRQSDLKKHERQGLLDFMKVCKDMKSFQFIEFNLDDIVRSKLVKDFITTAYKHNLM